jgi:hypothetical protein
VLLKLSKGREEVPKHAVGRAANKRGINKDTRNGIKKIAIINTITLSNFSHAVFHTSIFTLFHSHVFFRTTKKGPVIIVSDITSPY